MEASQHLNVGVRVRPLLPCDLSPEYCLTFQEPNQISLTHRNECITSAYDRVFPETAGQQEIFEFVASGVQAVPKGYNCTILAYGQTGSGKTYTMFGTHGEAPAAGLRPSKPAFAHTLDDPETYGIVPNAIHAIFDSLRGRPFTVYCSFLQIYNEKLYDLLQDPRRDKALNIRERGDAGIFVENLAEYVVESADDCFHLLLQGDRNRAVRQTKLNFNSSRSHTIFQILLEADKANRRGNLERGKLNLCDLAGSEKYDKEAAMKKEHIQEMTMINKSLSTLGQVVSALGKGSKHIPYRNSKLTRLLQDSLAVNTRTYLLATVAPSVAFLEETVNTLKFADRAREVMIKVKRNEVAATSDALVCRLQSEVSYLKSLLSLHTNGGLDKVHEEIQKLREENDLLKQLTKSLTVEEVEELKQENKQLKLQLQELDSGFFVTQPTDIVSIDSKPPDVETVLQAIEPGQSVEDALTVWRQKELDTGVMSLKDKLNRDGRCPVCTLKVPCKHYSSLDLLPRMSIEPPPKSIMDSLPKPRTDALPIVSAFSKPESALPPRPLLHSVNQPRMTKTPLSNRVLTTDLPRPRRASSTDRQKQLSVRYRSPNSSRREAPNIQKLSELRRKEVRESEQRLMRLAQIEEYREAKVRRELEKLEEEKRKEEEERRKQEAREARRKEYMHAQKQRLLEYKRTKEAEFEALKKQQLKEEQKKKLKEANKQKQLSKQKKLVEDFHARKRLEDGIMLSRIDDLANDLLHEKLSKESLNP